MQEEIRILLRQSEVVHLLGVDQLGQALSWCYWEELQQCLGSLDQFGGGVQSLGLVDHSDELMRRRLGGINVKPCIGDVGRGVYMRRMKERIGFKSIKLHVGAVLGAAW